MIEVIVEFSKSFWRVFQRFSTGKYGNDFFTMRFNRAADINSADIGARREIFKLLREAVSDDMAILCATSDYEQLVELADRVLILADGEIREELFGSEITKESMAKAIYS